VGLEPLGLEEFVEGNFFAGELFVDKNKGAFKKLGFRQMSYMEIISSLLSRKWRDANAKAKSLNLGGNLSGDGYQNGGCLIVGAGGGPTLLAWKQDNAADHVENDKVLEVLGIAQQ